MSDKWSFGWRLALVLALGLLLYSFLSYTVGEVKEHLSSESYGQSIEDYDYDLYAGNYSQMRWRLNHANPRGEEFQLYWDVADAYTAYELCEFWRLAGESPAAEADCGRYEEKYREQLLHIYENSGEQARRYIRSFADGLLP